MRRQHRGWLVGRRVRRENLANGEFPLGREVWMLPPHWHAQTLREAVSQAGRLFIVWPKAILEGEFVLGNPVGWVCQEITRLTRDSHAPERRGDQANPGTAGCFQYL